MLPGAPRGLMLVPLLYFATIGYLWVVTDNKEADQRQQTAVACTASQNAIALLIAATWDMRAAEMDPVVPTMNELSECEFRFFETDWRITNEYSLEQVNLTTFTGKTGWTSYTITFRDPRMVNVGCMSPMKTFKVPSTSSATDSDAELAAQAVTDPVVRRQLPVAESPLRQPQLTDPLSLAEGLHSNLNAGGASGSGHSAPSSLNRHWQSQGEAQDSATDPRYSRRQSVFQAALLAAGVRSA